MTLSFTITENLTDVPPPPRTTWHLGKLKRPNNRDKIAACQYIDDIHEQLCDTIISALDSVCGRRIPKEEDYMKNFWTPEMTAAFNRKEYLYKKWRKAIELNCLQYWLQHQEAQAALRRLVTKRRKDMWKLFCDQMAQGEYTKAIAKFSKIRKNRKIKATFTTTEGPQHSADTMAHHLQLIYAGNFLPARAPRDVPSQLDPQPFDITNCPFDIDTINTAIKELPQHKAPGVDYFTIEMLSRITDIMTRILLYIFRLCWQWSYTPLPWRVAQVIPIQKRSSFPSCPPLDIAQGGFRPARSTLDQALCLLEICSTLRRKRRTPSTLAFLDIKSAYDTVDRDFIWQTLQPSLSPPLLALIRHLFDDVYIEVLVSNATSSRFTPTTGVLQGSILSPFLYSIYINQLPSLLRHQPLDESPSQDICRLTESLNCLLYADDVVLIANPTELEVLLQKCEEHSQRLGYRWNPLKCAILAPPTDSRRYFLYDTLLPRQASFSYLGIPISPGGFLNTNDLVQNNINKALQTMNQMSDLGVNPKGFDRLLSVRFHTQIYTAMLDDGTYDSHAFAGICKQYLEDNLDDRRNSINSVLLSSCRLTLGVDPILWLSMSNTERSRIVR
ncbi:hypothetical protein G6F28_010218 [Rhizopus arrhizus]|nr:hypothetical protein G6F28_010218 [Rhizopus arrhizus]